jgi:DNA-binding response OmpR family regulator
MSLTKRWALLAEDETDLAQDVASELTRNGFMVIAVDSVSDGALRIQNQKFSVIILDWNLGRQTADLLIQKARSGAGDNQYTPIVLISGVLDRDILESVKGNVQKAFVKPFALADLVQAAKELVEE